MYPYIGFNLSVFIPSEMEQFEMTKPGSKLCYPVIILEGVNYCGQFACGDMHPNVVTNDIKSYLTFEKVHDLIGQASSDFIMVTLGAGLNATEEVEKAADRQHW